MADSQNSVNGKPHFTFIWMIENACFPCYIRSPTFTIKEMEMTMWYLLLYIDDRCVIMSVWREDKDDGPDRIEIKIALSFLGIDGLPLIEKEIVTNFKNGDIFSFDDFAAINEVFFQKRKEFLPKDALTVRCHIWRTGTGISQLDSCFAASRLRPDGRSFVWAIREFSTLQTGQVRKIIPRKTSTTELTLNLFLTEINGEEYVEISAQCSGVGAHEYYVTKIFLLDFEGEVVHSEKSSIYGSKIFLFEKFFEKSRLVNDKLSLLLNDVLFLRCEVEMIAQIVWNIIENYRYFNSTSSNVIATSAGEILRCQQDESKTSSFTEAMKSLIEEGTLSDVSLRVGSKSFPAHKCILSARSPVFKAMFTGDLKEKTSKSVEITDVDEDTLKELLSYIYTDTLGELQWQDAADLYRAADKYELLDLKTWCSTVLKSNLSVSSACAILVVADLHQDKELRAAAADYIMMRGKEFFTSAIWRRFKEEHSEIYVEILEKIVSNIKSHH